MDLTVDPARAVYLILLGSVLIAGIFSMYRSRPGTALRHAAIWVLIFAGAVIVYGFSAELQGQLMPRVAQQGADGTLTLRRSRDGQFHARLMIEGTRVSALVDTGASDLVLTREDARRIGFDPEALAYTRRAMTANGVVRGAPVRLDTVRLGPFAARDVPAVVNGGVLGTSLLGMAFLDRFAGFEVRGDTLTLHP